MKTILKISTAVALSAIVFTSCNEETKTSSDDVKANMEEVTQDAKMEIDKIQKDLDAELEKLETKMAELKANDVDATSEEYQALQNAQDAGNDLRKRYKELRKEGKEEAKNVAADIQEFINNTDKEIQKALK